MNSNVFSLIQFLLWAVNCCNRCLQFFTVGCQLTQIDLCNGRITHTHTHTRLAALCSPTDNHASTSPLSFLQAGCPSCCPTNSVKALKAQWSYNSCGYYCLVMHILFPTILACLHHTTLKALLELIWDIAFVGLTVCMVESVIGTVCTVCGAGFMKQYGVRPPVCLSVPFIHCSSVQLGLLLWARREISTNCCTAGATAALGRSTLSSSKCGQCHVLPCDAMHPRY